MDQKISFIEKHGKTLVLACGASLVVGASATAISEACYANALIDLALGFTAFALSMLSCTYCIHKSDLKNVDEKTVGLLSATPPAVDSGGTELKIFVSPQNYVSQYATPLHHFNNKRSYKKSSHSWEPELSPIQEDAFSPSAC